MPTKQALCAAPTMSQPGFLRESPKLPIWKRWYAVIEGPIHHGRSAAHWFRTKSEAHAWRMAARYADPDRHLTKPIRVMT